MVSLIRVGKYCISIASSRLLKEFYKAVHPDILGRAPTRVKEENTRSLKALNDYLDRLRKSSADTNGVHLKFYTIPKDNGKSKRYLDFSVDLEGWRVDQDDKERELIEKATIEKINRILIKTKLDNVEAGSNPPKENNTDLKFMEKPIGLVENEIPSILSKSSSKRQFLEKVE